MIVDWMGADSDTYAHSVTYLRIVILDMPFLFMVNIFQATRQSQGDTVSPMLLNFLGIILNMILDPVLMVVFQLGVAGAAIATLVSKAFVAVIAFSFLCNKTKPVHLDVRYMKPEKDKIKAILSLGLPSAIGGCAQQLGFLLLSKNVFFYGAESASANMTINGRAHVAESGTFHCRLCHAFFKAGFCGFNQAHCFLADFAHRKGVGTVAVEATDERTHINLDDVALFQDSRTGRNSVDDLVIDADAGTAGKSAVAEKGRLGTAFFNVAPDLQVNLGGGHTFADHLAAKGESLAGDPACHFHLFNLIGILYKDHLSSFRYPAQASRACTVRAVVSSIFS